MKKSKKGFTLIEVAIFLAITALLFVGVAMGVQNSLEQQRENDVVQNYMEFLRTAYSQAFNVQNSPSAGQSEMAIYGKLVTFGEKYNLEGNENSDHEIFTYTIVGNITESGSGSSDTLDLLADLKANVFVDNGDQVGYAGIVNSYKPKWEAQIQPALDSGKESYAPFTGSLLIVRHPTTGNSFTYYSDKVVEVNQAFKNGGKDPFEDATLGNSYLRDGSFKREAVDFCVNPSPDAGQNVRRFDVRIIAGAHNASGIELIPENNSDGMNGNENKCNK